MMQATPSPGLFMANKSFDQCFRVGYTLSSLPMLIFGAFARVLSDRFDRRKTHYCHSVIAMIVAFVLLSLFRRT
jgi:MFS family permease